MAIEFQRNPGQVEQRRVRRTKVALPGTVRERSRSAVPATVVDLSVEGCRIESGGVPLEGNHIWVRLEGLESLSGRVAWCNGYIAGISFAQPLHPAVAARFTAAAGDLVLATGDVGSIASNIVAFAALRTRREQIIEGIAQTERSPLSQRKAPTGSGILGVISRQVMRRADHRHEERFGDASTTAPMALQIDRQPANVENVSASGLCVRAPLGSDIGSRVPVEFEGCDAIEGQVVGLADGLAGLSLPAASIDLCDR